MTAIADAGAMPRHERQFPPLFVFDFDGTLVDSAPVCAAIVNAMLRDRGAAQRVTADGWAALQGSGAGRVRTLMGGCARPGPHDIDEFRRRYRKSNLRHEVYDDVRPTLARLQRSGVCMAVCSAKLHDLLTDIVGELGLAGFFDAMLGFSPAQPCKPDPRHLAALLALTGRPFADLLVGDDLDDQLLAEATGTPFVRIDRLGHRSPCPAGTTVIRTLADLHAAASARPC